MVGRKTPHKRKREFDPTASDSNDEDYNEEEAVAPRSARKTTKASQRGKKGPKSTKSRRKKNSYSDDDDDDDDEDEMTEISEVDYVSDGSEEDAAPSVNKSGRPTRRAAAKAQTYEESDPDDIKDEEEATPQETVPVRGTKIVRLKINATDAKFANMPQPSVTATTPVTPSIPRRSTRASSKEPQSVPKLAPSVGRSTRGASVGASTRVQRSTRQSSVGPGKGRQGSAEPANPLGRRSSRLHPELELETPLGKKTNSGDVDYLKTAPMHPSTVQEEDEEQSDEAPALPAAGEIEKPAVETSTEAVYGGSLEVVEPEGDQDAPGEADEDEDELPTQRSRRKASSFNNQAQPSTPPPRGSPRKGRAPSTVSPTNSCKSPGKSRSQNALEPPQPTRRGGSRGGSQTRGSDDDDWRMDEHESDGSDDLSESDGSAGKPAKKPFVVEDEAEEYSEPGRRSTRGKGSQGGGVSKRKRHGSDEEQDLLEEIANLQDSPGTRRSKRRAAAKEDLSLPRKPQLRERTAKVDYRIINPDFQVFGDDLLQTPIVGPDAGFGASKKNGASASVPQLYGTSGPFGGWGAATPIFGKTPFMGPGADSDSSDDEGQQQNRPGVRSDLPGHNTAGGTQPNLLPPTAMLNPELNPADIIGGPSNFGSTNVGKPGAGKSSADSDPLGIDQNVTFDSVGGHDEHIRQLREMVALPLMYPEIFKQFGVTPPKGVLFHGPPGTGKTLMARALASSCSTQTGKKVTFFMRKGADCLSKWVGEAERQLRLLFEEAKNAQPSIIFFDEIDGLAPVRSSKQDQIHASIVSTLLALMDGMDGRGQIIVIGATNRPDSVDPALRRPGRFDREFYFPLPDVNGRLKIIDIHTKNWIPPLSDEFKKELAIQTKGFGGADIRGMCTEAALNAVQRVYPQLYTSWDKYIIDPTKIKIVAADFLKAIKKIVPSSERSTSSGAAPLPKHIEPLLQRPLDGIKKALKKLLPELKRMTVLEEAMYEDDPDPASGFEREKMLTDFENARIFRPRLLVHGPAGMGQQYLAGALLHHFEGFHVQSFDMATLQSDPMRSPEAAVIQYFVEVKRHKPSVIFIPNMDTWYHTMGAHVVETFIGLLRSIPPSDPIMLVGIVESPIKDLDPKMLSDFFGYTKANRYELIVPSTEARTAYFKPLASHIKKSPSDFPDPTNRPKRKIEELPRAPPSPPHQPTREELEAQARRDGQIRNWLRIGLMGWIDQTKQRYKKLKKPVIDHQLLINLGKEQEPPSEEVVTSDIAVPVHKPYEITADKHGAPMVLEVDTGKKYYNIDVDIIALRVSNGYYCLPRQFLDDIKLIAIDAQTLGTDKERILRANEMVANAEVFVTDLETKDPNWLAECERLYQRQLEKQRAKETKRAAKEAKKVAESTAAVHAAAAAATAAAVVSGISSNGISNGERSPKNYGSPSKASQSADLQNLISPDRSKPTEVDTSNSTSLTNGVSHSTPPPQLAPMQPQFQSPQDVEMSNSSSSNGSYATQAYHTAPPSSHPTYLHYSSTTTSVHGPLTAKMHMDALLAEGPSDLRSSQRTSSGASAFTQNSSSNGRYSLGSTQGASMPDFHEFDGIDSADSQLPDTQVLSSSEGSGGQGSQAFPMQGSQPLPYSQISSYPAHDFSSVPADFKGGEFKRPERISDKSDSSNNSKLENSLIVNIEAIDRLPDDIAVKTQDFTVEQLEQVNAALMETIWVNRSNWNRTDVLGQVKNTLREVLQDIGDMQSYMPRGIDDF
ncbi:hypothetical protein BDZ91DRAFT_479327 [Kalaharituber pfeilii]|nr:hypothetical protein BDZ91DRAFT_479327 [Kalaharituber pfeilii]